MAAVVIEIDGPRNECLQFRPLQRRVRGAFDFMRDPEPMAKVAAGQQPNPVPGQRLGFDYDKGVGFLEEPLRHDEHTVTRERIEAKGFRIPPAREEFEDADACTWTFWLQQAVEAGVARVVDGKFQKVNGEPRRNFLTVPTPSVTDRLAAALERQNLLFDLLIKKLS